MDREQVLGGSSLDNERLEFALRFAARADFLSKYEQQATGQLFVETLLQNIRQVSALDLGSQRADLLASYNSGSYTQQSRALVLHSIADNIEFKQSQSNAAFVLSEYFCYLRRDPDEQGYSFWLNVLSAHDRENYKGMVCSFITSAEYQKRFSLIPSRSNHDCRE